MGTHNPIRKAWWNKKRTAAFGLLAAAVVLTPPYDSLTVIAGELLGILLFLVASISLFSVVKHGLVRAGRRVRPSE